ncbi:hypothetical protein KAR91_55390 [Candidatus Pacearchaeota archaeon]|nr:hypothetical protein [Candidatus Pacearchaeota archaeon]
MSTKLRAVPERSTKIIDLGFLDEGEAAKDPKTLKWTLTDTLGNVINSQEDVDVPNPSSAEAVVLSGDDLAIFDDEATATKGKRLVTAEATYDSNELGSDLTLTGEANFTVVDLTVIANEATP